MILQTVIIALIVLVAVGILVEARSWARHDKSLPNHQKIYRIAAAVLVEAVLIMILVSKSYLEGKSPAAIAYYWTIALALAFLLFVLALLDIRATLVTYEDKRADMIVKLVTDNNSGDSEEK